MIKILRKDRLVPAVQAFISNALGSHFVQPLVFNIETVYEQTKKSQNYAPILLLTKDNFEAFP